MRRSAIRAFPLFIATVFAAGTSARATPITIYNPNFTSGSYNVIANFEPGNMSEFTGSFGTGNFNASNAAPIIGNYSAVTNTLSNASGPGYAALKTINVVFGEQYVVSGLFNRGNITTGGFYIDLNEVLNEVQFGVDASSAQTQFVYDTYTPHFTGQITLRMVRDGQRLAGESGYIDNIGFTPLANFVAPVPEPTCLAAFPIAAAALLRRKR